MNTRAMTNVVSVAPVAAALALAGCSLAVDSGAQQAPELTSEEQTEVRAWLERDRDEPVGQAVEELTAKQIACVSTCIAENAVLCSSVSAICAASDVVTIGGVTVPCAVFGLLASRNRPSWTVLVTRSTPVTRRRRSRG